MQFTLTLPEPCSILPYVPNLHVAFANVIVLAQACLPLCFPRVAGRTLSLVLLAQSWPWPPRPFTTLARFKRKSQRPLSKPLKRSRRRAGSSLNRHNSPAASPDGYTLDKKPTLRCTVGFKWSYQEGSLRLLPEPRHHLPRALEDCL